MCKLGLGCFSPSTVVGLITIDTLFSSASAAALRMYLAHVLDGVSSGQHQDNDMDCPSPGFFLNQRASATTALAEILMCFLPRPNSAENQSMVPCPTAAVVQQAEIH